MPLYEYQCDACGHRFEVIQKFSDPPAETCPVCGGAVRKLLSSPAIQFKGSGWYITDYARKGGGESASDGAKPAAPASSTEGDSKSAGEAKSGESKPAASATNPSESK
jgi:putative FmdB family regulatory protein